MWGRDRKRDSEVCGSLAEWFQNVRDCQDKTSTWNFLSISWGKGKKKDIMLSLQKTHVEIWLFTEDFICQAGSLDQATGVWGRGLAANLDVSSAQKPCPTPVQLHAPSQRLPTTSHHETVFQLFIILTDIRCSGWNFPHQMFASKQFSFSFFGGVCLSKWFDHT